MQVCPMCGERLADSFSECPACGETLKEKITFTVRPNAFRDFAKAVSFLVFMFFLVMLFVVVYLFVRHWF